MQAVKAAMPAAHAPEIHCDLALVQSGSLAVSVLAAPCMQACIIHGGNNDYVASFTAVQLSMKGDRAKRSKQGGRMTSKQKAGARVGSG